MTALAELVGAEKDRIARLWAKRLVADSHVEAPSASIREPLSAMVYELARLLKERGEDAIRLWPEAVRAHGHRRFSDRYEASDLVREMEALQEVLLFVYARRRGGVDPDVAELIAELVGEGTAAAVASFTRVLRTEEVRFREAALMESVLHHVDVGILVAEEDGTITFGTPPIERLLGVPVRTLRGAAQERLAAVLRLRGARHLDGAPFRAAELPLLRALREKAPVRGVSCVLRRPDGAELTLEMNAVPLFDDSGGGELVGAIQTFADRTESASKTRELSRAYRDLSEVRGQLLQRTRSRALGQLAASTAHALNNFLNVLRLRLTLLRKDARPDHLDALDRLTRNLGDTIGRLQSFSSESPGEEPVEVELEGAVREAIELTRERLEAGEHPVQVEVSSLQRGRVMAEPVFLREVVMGLLLAARERMPQGGRVLLAAQLIEGAAVLQITDEGPPLDPEELSSMFDPLKGKPAAPDRSLLLGVARTEVQRWGGELHVEPQGEPARGVTFTLKLPLVAAPAAERTPAAAAGEPERRRIGLRVLVVDDDPDNAWMLAQVLGDEGYQVQVAHSASAARELWSHQHFDAALLDVMMPDVSGWELARELRQTWPDMLLAMVTGADVRGQSRANLAQVDAVFGKPIDVGALDEFLSQPGASAREGTGQEGPQRGG